MNKKELIEAVQKALGKETTLRLAEEAVEAVLDSIAKGIKKNKKVQLIGFGVFEVKKRAARMGRNPKTGESMKIKASKTIGFKASQIMLAAAGGRIVGNSPKVDSPVIISEKSGGENHQGASERIEVGRGSIQTIWFGTNRECKKTAEEIKFTGKYCRSVTYGKVRVFIPEAHRFGEIGSSFWNKLLRWDFRDDTIKIDDVEDLAQTTFWKEMKSEMIAAKRAGSEAQALVYIHGYNNSFEDAAIRAAQLDADLGIQGITAFYSWPSKASKSAYVKDEARIEASEKAITEFLISFSEKSGAQKIHIIAHSMGNRGLLRALHNIMNDDSKVSSVKFGQIFLAAPDIDRELFLNLANVYEHFSDRATLYASNGDRAVKYSGWLHGMPRAGYFKPYTVVSGVDTIAVPDFNIDFLGHAYFSQAEGLLHDIYDLISHNTRPDKRQRLKEKAIEEGTFWELRR